MKLRGLLEFAAPHRWSLVALTGLTLASSAVLLALPWLAGQMIGGMLVQKAPTDRILALLLGALILLAAVNAVALALSSATSARILADLRARVYDHLQALPLAFHHQRRQGDILALATFEVARLGRFVTSTMVSFPSRLLTALGAVVLMFKIDPGLALLVPTLVPIFYIILKVVGRRLRRVAVASQQAEADVVATIEKNLGMLAAIKSFAREDREAAAYRFHVHRSMNLSIQEGRIHALLEPLVGLVAASAAVVLLFVAGRNVSAGTMSAAQLFSFLFYAALLTRPIAALAHLYGDMQAARGTLERLQSVLSEPIEPGYRAAAAVPPARGHVEFENVSFAFPGRGTVLDKVSIDIRPGEKIALVGDNGAGKTTLMNLLLRFIDPDNGVIRLDGRDIAMLQVQDLRRRIGVVPQQAALFNGSIRANIAFGADDSDDAALLRAAELAQADAFIAALPDGLDTEIGDHGVRLSGGERQRLSLARAIVKDPPILLLDEATSMFDLDGEAAFIEAGRLAFEGRTVIFTTHRPASLAIADRILRVGGGAVGEISNSAARETIASGDDDER